MTDKSNVPVVILCGGKGTRLKEETEYRPKPMVHIGDRPILWHIMKIYAHFGYDRFVLALGYKGEMVKEHFLLRKWLTSDFTMGIKSGEVTATHENGSQDDFHVTFADTGEETKTGERLKMVERYILGERFMVTYGDGVADINVDDLVAFHERQGTVGTIAGVHPTSKYGLVGVDERSRVTSFEQKPVLSDFVNGGFMVFTRRIFQYLKPNQMIEEALADLIRDRELSLYQHNGFWHSMDTHKDFEDLNRMWANEPRWRIWKN